MKRDPCLLVAAMALPWLIAAVPASAAPDWNRLDDTLEGGIGLHAGLIGGSGLAFKYPIKWWLQFQVAGGIWNTEDNQRHNVGFEVQYVLRQDPRLRLFLLAGAGYYHHRKLEEDAWLKTSWNKGFGVGIERLMGERWSFKVDVSFTHRQDKESIAPWPQAGIFFYW
jgi:hypothetical protein